MPGFDRTGPFGEGPMTGRGLGPCGRGLGVRRGFGRGMGRGFGRGFRRGFGFRRSYVYDYEPVEPAFTQILTKEQEKTILDDEMKVLKEDMEAIKKRIKEIEKQN